MKKLMVSAGALFLSSSAVAGILYDGATTGASGVGAAAYAVAASPMVGTPSLQRALLDAGLVYAGTQSASGDKGQWTGVGGPEEPAVWPACRPGPGDDRCIQLYERGVREDYAAWSANGSGTAMGGPEMGDDGVMVGSTALLPKDSSLAAMDADWSAGADTMVDRGGSTALLPKDPSLTAMDADWNASGTTMADASGLTAKNPSLAAMQMGAVDAPVLASKPMMTHPDADYAAMLDSGSEHTGVGGPEESIEPRVYPRCRSRSDDSCQQGR